MISLRRGRTGDAPALLRLVETVFREYGLWRHHRLGLGDLAEVEKSYRRGGGEFLVAVSGGRVVGCGGLRVLHGGDAAVQRMFLARAARGRGLGRAVLERLEAHARRRGVRRLALETSPRFQDAIRLYLRAGFEACRLDCGGCCDIVMIKEI